MYVDLKVTDEISFKDLRRRGQEITWTMANTLDSGRTVHVAGVTGSDGSSYIRVERVDALPLKDNRARGQETIVYFDNSQEPPVHLDTYETKVYAKNADSTLNTGTWVKVQRYKSFPVKDLRDRGQESIFYFDNPDLRDENWDYDYTNAPLVTTYDNTTINPPWRIDPFQNIVDVSWASGNLFVMYSGNKVAIIDTASLSGATATVTLNRTLSTSNWGTNRLRVCQLKLKAGDESLVFSPIKVSANVLTAETKHHLGRNSLTEFVESSLEAARGVPVFNGDGINIYTPWDDFSVTGLAITKTQSLNDYISYEADPQAISATGDRYSAYAKTQFLTFCSIGGYSFLPHVFTSDQEGTGVFDADAMYSLGGPGSSDIEIFRVNFGDAGTASKPFKYHKFSQSGGVDTVAIEDVNATLTYNYSGIFSYFGLALRWWDRDNDAVSLPYTNAYLTSNVVPFPFSLSTDRNKFWFYWEDYYERVTPVPDITRTIETPYGDFVGYEQSGGVLSSDSSTQTNIFNGWMHLSNGSHYLQAFVARSQAHVYYDGQDVGSKIATALGVTVNDIQAMLLDVPVARIESLL